MGVVNKINKLLQTKTAIRQAIIGKGVEVPEDTVFADYPSKINAIESGGSGDVTTYEQPDFYEFRTNGGTNYSYLFYNVKTATQFPNLLTLDTSNVTNMEAMFSSCSNLTSLDLSSFDTSNVTNMQNMFSGCTNLTSLDVSNFDTSNVTDIQRTFQNCTKLTEFGISNWDTSKVTSMYGVFWNCSSLISLDISSWDTSNVQEMQYMFFGCTKLTTLNMRDCDISKVTNLGAMFNSCTALVDFNAPKNISAAMTFSSCPNLTHDSLMSIINNLATVTSTKKLTLGATNLAKLTDEEKVIATNKGWTLA